MGSPYRSYARSNFIAFLLSLILHPCQKSLNIAGLWARISSPILRHRRATNTCGKSRDNPDMKLCAHFLVRVENNEFLKSGSVIIVGNDEVPWKFHLKFISSVPGTSNILTWFGMIWITSLVPVHYDENSKIISNLSNHGIFNHPPRRGWPLQLIISALTKKCAHSFMSEIPSAVHSSQFLNFWIFEELM